MAKILLVDDVELFIELEKSFFDGLGYEILTARSGEEALEMVSAARPDLVLLDLFMQGIDGDEVCRRLRAEPEWQRLPVIMVTAAGKQEQIQKCVEAGCDDYITKPISKQALIEKVQRLLGKVRSRTAPRMPVSIRVQLQADGRSIETCAQDISRNGIYVKSSNLLEVGSAVHMQLDLPDGRQVPVMGKVKRVRQGMDSGMGIYFVHPDAEGLKALQSLTRSSASPVGPGPAPPPPTAGPADEEKTRLAEENCRLRARISELETENQDFATQLVETEQINNNLNNLYIASTRLHAELDRSRVVHIIEEVVINFVGAEKFALLMNVDEEGVLRFEAGEGFSAGEFPQLASEGEPWRQVVCQGESFYRGGSMAAGSDDPHQPLAAIPLLIHQRCLGVLAIYRLFVQKDQFAPVDYQLFSMMAEQAATALFSASLYEASERKRETYRGFMDLLLK